MPALSGTVIVPVRVPVAVGANFAEIVQLPPAGTLCPTAGQLPMPPKEKSPVIANGAVMVSAELLLLVRVAVSTELVVPTEAAGKVNGLGEIVTVALELAPVPLRLTTCGLPLALSETESVPLTVPDVVGLKVTLMVQLAPAATLAPQLLD